MEVTKPGPARPSVLFCKYLRVVIHLVSVLHSSQNKRAFVGAHSAVETLKLKTKQNFLLLCSDRKLEPSTMGAWLVAPRSGLGGLSLTCWCECGLMQRASLGCWSGLWPQCLCHLLCAFGTQLPLPCLSVLISKMDMKE